MNVTKYLNNSKKQVVNILLEIIVKLTNINLIKLKAYHKYLEGSYTFFFFVIYLFIFVIIHIENMFIDGI